MAEIESQVGQRLVHALLLLLPMLVLVQLLMIMKLVSLPLPLRRRAGEAVCVSAVRSGGE